MPLSALGFQGSGAALVARGVRLPADAVWGGVAESKERDGRTVPRGPSKYLLGPGGVGVAVVGRGWMA